MGNGWIWLSALLALSSVGCGAASEDGGLVIGDEEESGEPLGSTSQAITGCAATVIASEGHVGTFFSNPRSIFIDELSYRLHNPSATNCVVMTITILLKNDITQAVIHRIVIETSLTAGRTRRVYWTGNYNSSTWWVTAELLRNGTSLRETYVPTYFTQTGQN
jgi:hypothetical protein